MDEAKPLLEELKLRQLVMSPEEYYAKQMTFQRALRRAFTAGFSYEGIIASLGPRANVAEELYQYRKDRQCLVLASTRPKAPRHTTCRERGGTGSQTVVADFGNGATGGPAWEAWTRPGSAPRR